MKKTRFNTIENTRKSFYLNQVYRETSPLDSSGIKINDTPYLPINTKEIHSFIVDWQIPHLHCVDEEWP